MKKILPAHIVVIFLLLVINVQLVLLLHSTLAKQEVFSRDNNDSKHAFIDVLDQAGIDRIPYSSGAAWVDYDNDDYLDLLIAGNKTALYHNNGNGTFTNVTKKAGIRSDFSGVGIFGDYDNDGCEDLFLTGLGHQRNQLYHNNCDETFTNVTDTSGIEKESYNGFGATWADYDNDGYLDLYIANFGYNDSGNRYAISEPNILYHNNKDGTFTNSTIKVGLEGASRCRASPVDKLIGKPFKPSFQPIWFDYNNDGKLDLFIATDTVVSPLYRNNGDSTFTEVTREAGLCRSGSGMGATIGDYDNDGYLDLYVTNVGANYLWHNRGDGTFSEVAAETGVADPLSIGWGTEFFDYDNDGYLDLYVANGEVKIEDLWSLDTNTVVGKVKLDRLYKNTGATFTEVSFQEGIVGDDPKKAVAFGDYNNDGFIDIFVVSSHESNSNKYRLYKNQGNQNHWLTIMLVGTKSNRDSIGARITLTANGKTQIREVVSGSSFISQNSLWQTFGLGKSSIVDTIEITWPSGIKKLLHNIKSNHKLVVSEKLN